MLFSTPLFLYVFFPAFFLGYFLTPRRHKNAFALLGSLIFYAWGEPVFVFVLIAALMVDYALGRKISAARVSQASRARVLLIFGVTLNLSLLAVFKYLRFFLENLGWLLDPFRRSSFHLPALPLPLGISFFVFEEITYLVDLYRGEGRPAKRFLDYATYICLFPKLLAGPIVKYHDIAEQLESRETKTEDVAWGLGRFIVGLGKKVLVADAMARLADKAFSIPLAALDPGAAWVGIAAFTVQIYFDFSGYSDMAIGMARMMGFTLQENFDRPYLAESFTEFWRRWHISLSTWIKSYLYIPLGGSRVSVGRTYLNLVLCFALCGLWHGASWTFIVWGLYHGFFLVMDKLFWLEASRRLPRALNRALTVFLIAVGFVIFRSPTLPGSFVYLSRLFGLTGATALGAQRVFLLDLSDAFFFALAASWILAPAFASEARAAAARLRPSASLKPAHALGLVALLLLSLIHVSLSSFNPFIYFRF